MQGPRIVVGVVVAASTVAPCAGCDESSPEPGTSTMTSLARRAVIAAGSAHLVTELQLVVGYKRYDVVPDRALELEGGGEIVLVPWPIRRTSGPGFHVTHRHAVRVVTTPSRLYAVVEGAHVTLQLWDPDVSRLDLASTLALAQVQLGETRGTTTARRVIAGEPRVGKRYELASHEALEVFHVPFGATHLAVHIFHAEPEADLRRIEELLASVTPGVAAPAPLFLACVGDQVLPLYLDRAAELPLAPPVGVVLRRRPLVRRVVIGAGGMITFEHPPGLAVARDLAPHGLRVAIMGDRVLAMLEDRPWSVSPQEVLIERFRSDPNASEVGLVTHPYAGHTLNGYRARLTRPRMELEAYGFERDGHTIVAMLMYPTADQARALELALPIVDTLR